MKMKKSLACMIRGKSVEEAIRFTFFDHKDKLSIPAAQNYANDLYYLRTKHFPQSVVKFNAKPINILVKTGINAFVRMGIKGFKNINSFKLHNSRNTKFVFPDFIPQKIQIDRNKLLNCCLELKISNKKNYKVVKKHVEQCLRYATKSRKPVILLYLFFARNPGKWGQYSAFPKFFIISERNLAKFQK